MHLSSGCAKYFSCYFAQLWHIWFWKLWKKCRKMNAKRCHTFFEELKISPLKSNKIYSSGANNKKKGIFLVPTVNFKIFRKIFDTSCGPTFIFLLFFSKFSKLNFSKMNQTTGRIFLQLRDQVHLLNMEHKSLETFSLCMKVRFVTGEVLGLKNVFFSFKYWHKAHSNDMCIY